MRKPKKIINGRNQSARRICPMKTMNYKNVVVVAMNNCALIANSNGGYTTAMNCTDNTVASLKAMKLFLTKTPANSEELLEEPRLLILGEKSSIKGFAAGTHLQYIRTGANASGKAFTAEQLELIKEVAFLLADRSLNVRVTTDKYIDYSDKAARALINGAWENLKEEVKKNNAPAQTTKPQAPQAAPAVDPIAAIGLQIAEAAAKGDMAAVTALTAALTALKSAQATTPVAPVTNEVEVPEETVEEEMTDDELLDTL